MTAVRAEYLYALAAVCHCPPPVVDALALADFAGLTGAIDTAADGGD